MLVKKNLTKQIKILKYDFKSSIKRSHYNYTNIPAMPIRGKAPIWVDDPKKPFQDVLKSNQQVFTSAGAATPTILLDAMADVGKEKNLKNIMVCNMHTEGKLRYLEKEFEGIFRGTSFFMGANIRKAVAEGRADCIPIFLSDIPKLFYRKVIQPDICILNLSPPDKKGVCTLGSSVDCVRAGICHSKIIMGQINKHMIKTYGHSAVHISRLDYAYKGGEPLPSRAYKVGEKDKILGKLIAEKLVDDGCTIQMGIGAVPDAVLSALSNHKDLGIHSEMFSDGVIPLIEKGCINNSKKSQYQGQIVGSFLIGSPKLYQFADDNIGLIMLAVDYVNKFDTIVKQSNMVAINSCVEIDLTGQISADSIGTRMFSGFGGQLDFIRGAAETRDGKGKAIIAANSVSAKGVSKIVPLLKPGAGVVTSRAHVYYVVTEYGIAQLFGKNLRQRAYALINIAHPDHRESLEKAAYERLKVKPCP